MNKLNSIEMNYATALLAVTLGVTACDSGGGSDDNDSDDSASMSEPSTSGQEDSNGDDMSGGDENASDEADSNSDSSSHEDDSKGDTEDSGSENDEAGDDEETGSDEGNAMEYPEGPYGTQVGDTIENFSLLDENGAELSLMDFYQGEAKALALYITAAWCGSCKAKAQEYASQFAALAPAGFTLGVLYEGIQGEDATSQLAKDFNAGVNAFSFVSDPTRGTQGLSIDGNSIPILVVVDTSTMEIVFNTNGHSEAAVIEAMKSVIGD